MGVIRAQEAECVTESAAAAAAAAAPATLPEQQTTQRQTTAIWLAGKKNANCYRR